MKNKLHRASQLTALVHPRDLKTKTVPTSSSTQLEIGKNNIVTRCEPNQLGNLFCPLLQSWVPKCFPFTHCFLICQQLVQLFLWRSKARGNESLKSISIQVFGSATGPAEKGTILLYYSVLNKLKRQQSKDRRESPLKRTGEASIS